MMVHIDEVATMQHAAVARWHRHGLDNPFSGFLAVACHQCSLNYLLWHEEDAARSPTAEDGEVALIKRTIDQLNQQRNDYVEHMDLWIAEALAMDRVHTLAETAVNTETPGSAIDRLSILALRIYHLEEQLHRSEVDAQHLEAVGARLSICRLQHHDLLRAADQLLNDIFGGRKRHQIYRQFKMYNDPSLNPYLYRTVAWRHMPRTNIDNTSADAGQKAWPFST
jgi:hypothetical protein